MDQSDFLREWDTNASFGSSTIHRTRGRDPGELRHRTAQRR